MKDEMIIKNGKIIIKKEELERILNDIIYDVCKESVEMNENERFDMSIDNLIEKLNEKFELELEGICY